MFDKDLLLSVSKPGRYTDGEVNAVHKDLSRVRAKICLCFPDTYEIGMSHLGLRILYDVINRCPEYAAERSFHPWVDMADRMKAGGIPLTSLESHLPVREFDVVGFSLQYELSYTNVLGMLSLAGIPLSVNERGDQDPLVIAGGPCCLNPDPMAAFIDAFVIGEAEEAVLEVLEKAAQFKQGAGGGRRHLLQALASLPGVYVPALRKEGGASATIVKRIVKDLEKVLDLQSWIVPYIEIVHDRLSLEIMRGCPNTCRFCQARSSFYPVRLLKAEKVLECARRLYRQTGYEEISLLSLSSSDHPQLGYLVDRLAREFRGKGVSLSLPSVRAKDMLGDVSRVFATLRKTSLTFAPEAGSERLRQVIGKGIDIEDLFRVARQAFGAGYRLLKLYFMIGLPTETEEDLRQIVDLCSRLSQLKRETDKKPARVNVSLSNFIPKPHTAFQWQRMASIEELEAKQADLRRFFKRAGGSVAPSFHPPRLSFLEGVLSRGDRRLADVIRAAFEAGARFDAWGDFFDFARWQRAFEGCGVDPMEYVAGRPIGDPLAWDFIDTGISPLFLVKEAQSAQSQTI